MFHVPRFGIKHFSEQFHSAESEVSEVASAKMASAIDVRIDDMGSILKFRIGFPFGENSAGFCKFVWGVWGQY